MGGADAHACAAGGGDSFISGERIGGGQSLFALQQDGSFTSDTIMFEAHKAV
jgi:hypothetical protein